VNYATPFGVPQGVPPDDAALVDEVLGKLLCHNLSCLIMEQEALGIAPLCWKEEVQDDCNILRMQP
jgi:hypothetical protein